MLFVVTAQSQLLQTLAVEDDFAVIVNKLKNRNMLSNSQQRHVTLLSSHAYAQVAILCCLCRHFK